MIIGVIASITLICVFSAICYIVYTISDDSEDKGVSSGSISHEDDSTDSTLSIMSTDGGETISTGDSSSPDTTSTGESNPPTDIILYADNQYGKWGYVDQFRKERIPHIYEWADDFIDEYAAVRKNKPRNSTKARHFLFDRLFPEDIRAEFEHVSITKDNARVMVPILAELEQDKKYDFKHYMHENWNK